MWRNWPAGLKKLKPASPSAQQLRTVLLMTLLLSSLSYGISIFIKQQESPVSIVQHYYDDLDFRRYSSAYNRLDPLTRPSLDQYLLQLSVVNGLVASYGKLNSVYVHIINSESNSVLIEADAQWVTALQSYPTTYYLTMVNRSGSWYIIPPPGSISTPPDQFLRRPTVAWHSEGRTRVTTGTTAFGDILDRPTLQILSARLVRVHENYSIVGEIINTDVNPADVTVTALLFDKNVNTLSTYNAQTGMVHKLLPKEVTPFRVDFEGVAGTGLIDPATLAGAFKPGLKTPLNLKAPIASFQVYAKAVVTDHDLDRNVATRDVHVQYEADGKQHLIGSLFNTGTVEATIPHLLITYYDTHYQVAWVDSYYIEQAVEPESSETFDVIITPLNTVSTIINHGGIYTNILSLHGTPTSQIPWLERQPMPPTSGYSSFRISINYLIGTI